MSELIRSLTRDLGWTALTFLHDQIVMGLIFSPEMSPFPLLGHVYQVDRVFLNWVCWVSSNLCQLFSADLVKFHILHRAVCSAFTAQGCAEVPPLGFCYTRHRQ